MWQIAVHTYNYFMQIKNDKTVCYKRSFFSSHCLKKMFHLKVDTWDIQPFMYDDDENGGGVHVWVYIWKHRFIVVSVGRAIAKVKYTITFYPFTTFSTFSSKVNFSGDCLFFVQIDSLLLILLVGQTDE